jgi:hypothetical protein
VSWNQVCKTVVEDDRTKRLLRNDCGNRSNEAFVQNG